jgi:hypothetical protein
VELCSIFVTFRKKKEREKMCLFSFQRFYVGFLQLWSFGVFSATLKADVRVHLLFYTTNKEAGIAQLV